MWVTPEMKQEIDKFIENKEKEKKTKEQLEMFKMFKRALREDDDNDDDNSVDDVLLNRHSRSKSRGRSRGRNDNDSNNMVDDVEKNLIKTNESKKDNNSKKDDNSKEEDNDGSDDEERSPPKRKVNLDKWVTKVMNVIDEWEYDKSKKGNWSFVRKAIKKLVKDDGLYDKIIKKIADDNKIEQGNDKSLDIAVCRWLLANSK